ncbi:conserved protein of unknown function (plasmid) [Methylocella tundrae]|uniref:Uncharacterized protein n=1 Tax=Methylocella tundrae TaxID=227605 RepID=A0A4U8Z7N3_METTU|nr:conserved protein of unknown function [Methylocella tundrae]
MNSYLAAMRNYALFEGRAARSEFWCFSVRDSVFHGASIVDA